MENQPNEQIKIEAKDTTKESINYVSTDIKVNEKTDISELVGMLQSGTSEPSNKPTTLYGQIKIDSANNKVYFYDAVIGDWVTIGAGVVQQYTSSISHSNAELTSQTYDDTVTSTFKPHTVYFYGKIERGTDVANSVGQAGRTAPTQGVCSGFRYSGGVYQTIYETTKLGSNVMGNIYVLSWSDTGVVLRTTLEGYTGQNATITGTVILVG